MIGHYILTVPECTALGRREWPPCSPPKSNKLSVKHGQIVHRTKEIDNSEKQKNISKIRQANLHRVKRADRKIILEDLHYDQR